jgi:hypothetical protein
MSDRLKYRLHNTQSVQSVNTDTGIKIELQQTNKLLPADAMDRILDVGVQFQTERSNSSKYRFVFSLNGLFTNVLTDIDNGGDNIDTLSYFNDIKFLEDNSSNILFTNITSSVNNYRKDVNGWVGYYVPNWWDNTDNHLCKFIDLYPKREQFDLSPTNNIKNWDIFLSYPASANTTHFIIYNGLYINDKGIGNISGKQYISFMTPIKHNLLQGDMVNVYNNGDTGTTYNVLRLGDDNGNNEGNIFVIDLPTTSTLYDTGTNRMKKLVNSQTCEYYIRVFKKMTNDDDYEIYQEAFGKNLYSDKLHQVVFNDDIDISNYSDNKGRPLSEVYLSILKTNDNGFSQIDSGIEMIFNSRIASDTQLNDIHRIHNVSSWPIASHEPSESNITITNDLFYGDIVEYNVLTVEEVILGEFRHRFNRDNRDHTTSYGPRPEGYYYKPHYKIPLRYWSTFVEDGTTATTIGIPIYAENNFGDTSRYLWRDLLDIGLNDGQPEILDYPFLNGFHYRYMNFNINLKRQDPNNIYGLYYQLQPMDMFGKITDINNHVINKSNTGSGCCK